MAYTAAPRLCSKALFQLWETDRIGASFMRQEIGTLISRGAPNTAAIT